MSFQRIMQCSYKAKSYKSMGIQLCDVSLRDGLQTENVKHWTTLKKEFLCLGIMKRPENPDKIEVGSLASKYVYPIMADTQCIHKYATELNEVRGTSIEPFVLVPSFSKLSKALECGYRHLSFISSVSDAFQMKNTGVSVEHNLVELSMAKKFLDTYAPETRTKLYLSCFTECPIAGQLSKQELLLNAIRHMSLGFDELCLSDTCGTMTSTQFTEIVENLSVCGVSMDKLSLHLHVDESNADEVDKILRYCFLRGIRMFDVSSLETGGCSRTLEKRTKPNLSYEMFFGSLDKYLSIY